MALLSAVQRRHCLKNVSGWADLLVCPRVCEGIGRGRGAATAEVHACLVSSGRVRPRDQCLGVRRTASGLTSELRTTT